MKTNSLPLVAIAILVLFGIGAVLIVVVALGAGSLFAIVSSSVEQPTPVEVHDSMPTGFQLVSVDQVEVEVGVGSPIPVEIIASGTWPDLCAQIAEVQSRVDGFKIDVTILASSAESCPPDRLGLPFRFALPLNIVEMESGTYTITVNQVGTTFDVPVK